MRQWQPEADRQIGLFAHPMGVDLPEIRLTEFHIAPSLKAPS